MRIWRSKMPRRGFTLVELLVVIGIIAALIAILLPVVFSIQRKSEVSRIRLDLDTIAQALEEYKKVFNDYPRQDDPNNAAPHVPLLVTYLLGANGEGIRINGTGPNNSQTLGGKKWGPYLPVNKFKVSGNQLLDRSGVEIQYYPRYNSYDVRANTPGAPAGDGYLLGKVSASPKFASAPAIRAMFNRRDGLAGDGILPDSNDHQLHTLYMLGDGGDLATLLPNNRIDNTEVLTFNGPFMLVSAGPDGKWGLNAGALKRHTDADDVYNFGR